MSKHAFTIGLSERATASTMLAALLALRLPEWAIESALEDLKNIDERAAITAIDSMREMHEKLERAGFI